MRRSLLVVVALSYGCAASSQQGSSRRARAGSSEQASGHAHAAGSSWTFSSLSKGAKLFGDLGQVHRTVSTRSPEAQALFDQGLALTYGFNHDEAARSFARATELDPTCAMCFWGTAYTLGPNYNMPLLPERAKLAWEAINAAQAAAKANGNDVERALIEALSKRFKGPEWLDMEGMQRYNHAYAMAMREAAAHYPDDLDVQTLYAEALMNLNPWQLWTPDGNPAEHTEEIVQILERVISKAPEHVGANHMYIHAVEASKTPERALASADRLGTLVPGAGHLVHMPAHIYQRVGKYDQAAEANRRAVEVDQAYLERTTPPGYYAIYLGHNYGFLAYAASMQGRQEEALDAARKAATSLPKELVCGMPGMDFFLSEPLLVMVRFGMWDEILQEPKPDAKYQVLTGLWHHAQGMAHAGKGESALALEQAQAIRQIASALPDDLMADLNSAKQLLALAAKVVDARAAELSKDPVALVLWKEAVELEDALSYSEPADWFYPVRHYYGAALLDAGKPAEAEAVFREDLAENRDNGWALFGLGRALAAQKKRQALNETDRAFKAAFKDADIKLTRSAF
jgi:tetratricopeptide (TPR) repeat protein